MVVSLADFHHYFQPGGNKPHLIFNHSEIAVFWQGTYAQPNSAILQMCGYCPTTVCNTDKTDLCLHKRNTSPNTHKHTQTCMHTHICTCTKYPHTYPWMHMNISVTHKQTQIHIPDISQHNFLGSWNFQQLECYPFNHRFHRSTDTRTQREDIPPAMKEFFQVSVT